MTGTSDLDALARLQADEDGLTIEEMIAADRYEDVVIEEAIREGERSTISWDHGTTTSVKGPKVEVGDTVRFYGGAHLGDEHHGWALNGEVIEWQTPWERFAKRIQWLAGYDRSKRERITTDRAQVDAWLAELQGPYRERVERFSTQPNFIMEGGAYETYPVLMAQRIEHWVREQHPDAAPADWDAAIALVKELENLPYKKQEPVLHAGAEDKYGVSGHQVGSAFGMAAAVLCGRPI